MSAEAKDTLLHGQLQEGLLHDLMRASAVSGSQTYKELCVAARNEEKSLVELQKRRQYQQSPKDALRQWQEKPGDSKETKTTTHSKPTTYVAGGAQVLFVSKDWAHGMRLSKGQE